MGARRRTFSLPGLNQIMLVFGFNQVKLRRHQGLLLDHANAEDEEENVPAGHHGAIVRFGR